jgi:hypothetical protein
VGPIRSSDYNEVDGKFVFQGWMDLVDGQVGGVNVKQLAGAPAIPVPPAGQEWSSASFQSDVEKPGTTSGAGMLEWIQGASGDHRLLLNGRSDRIYRIERGVVGPDGGLQWEPHCSVVVKEGVPLEIPVHSGESTEGYRVVEE